MVAVAGLGEMMEMSAPGCATAADAAAGFVAASSHGLKMVAEGHGRRWTDEGLSQWLLRIH